MDAVEMGRRRWQNVPPEERSNLSRLAALARWSRATESDLVEARARAAKAREARTKTLAARLLGVDVSELTDVDVEILSSAKFRSLKSKEQSEYWKQLRQGHLVRTTCADARRAIAATVVHPASFRIVAEAENAHRS